MLRDYNSTPNVTIFWKFCWQKLFKLWFKLALVMSIKIKSWDTGRWTAPPLFQSRMLASSPYSTRVVIHAPTFYTDSNTKLLLLSDNDQAIYIEIVPRVLEGTITNIIWNDWKGSLIYTIENDWCGSPWLIEIWSLIDGIWNWLINRL